MIDIKINKFILERMAKALYRNKYGYIKGYKRDDGFFFIEEFVIKPEFRGKGFAKELMKGMPDNVELIAQPLYGFGIGLSTDDLISFYRKHGFELCVDSNGNNVMRRQRKP